MDPRTPDSKRLVLNIAIVSKANKKTAMERIDEAFPESDDDTIRNRITLLVHVVQAQHGTPLMRKRSTEYNDRLTLKRQVSRFIVQNLPEFLVAQPSSQDSPIELSKRLDALEASAKKLGWPVDQGRPASESMGGEQFESSAWEEWLNLDG